MQQKVTEKTQQALIHHKTNYLVSLKLEVHKLDIDKLKNVPSGLNSFKSKAHKLYFSKLETKPVDLKNLSDVIEKEVVKITEYDELNWLKKLNGIQTIDTSNLVKKTA